MICPHTVSPWNQYWKEQNKYKAGFFKARPHTENILPVWCGRSLMPKIARLLSTCVGSFTGSTKTESAWKPSQQFRAPLASKKTSEYIKILAHDSTKVKRLHYICSNMFRLGLWMHLRMAGNINHVVYSCQVSYWASIGHVLHIRLLRMSHVGDEATSSALSPSAI
jgi:hypothetical protein